MSGFLNAALGSDSDEEDDDYNPAADNTAEREDLPPSAATNRGGASKKRRRGAAIAAAPAAADGDDEDEDGEIADDGEPEQEAELDPRALAKRAKVAELWQEINSRAAAKGSATERPPSATVNLAALCRSKSAMGKAAKKATKAEADAIWMRSLGLLKKPAAAPRPPAPDASSPRQQHPAPSGAASADGTAAQRQAARAAAAAAEADGTAGLGDDGAGPSSSSAAAAAAAGPSAEEKRALAAAALAAARDATTAGSRLGKVAVTEVRRFAGKDIQVTLHVDKDSKEAQRAAARAAAPPPPPATSGLDAVLAEIEKKKKVSVLDKTKADWSTFKASNTEVDEELETYKKSADQYLDKQNFLKRAELREYEKERDTRLASDVRTRGRL